MWFTSDRPQASGSIPNYLNQGPWTQECVGGIGKKARLLGNVFWSRVFGQGSASTGNKSFIPSGSGKLWPN